MLWTASDPQAAALESTTWGSLPLKGSPAAGNHLGQPTRRFKEPTNPHNKKQPELIGVRCHFGIFRRKKLSFKKLSFRAVHTGCLE